MASVCRSAAVATARSASSVVFRAKPIVPRPLPSRRAATLLSRSMIATAVSTESLMPLHSAIASARLKSFIAVDSSHWSWLPQGRALPL